MKEDVKMPAILPRIFYTILFMLGVGLYVGWGVMFNIWLDVGVYAISVILGGFGLVGMLLYSYIERQELENNE